LPPATTPSAAGGPKESPHLVGSKVQSEAVDVNLLLCKFCKKEYVYRIWENIQEMGMDI
jgi:hypothetical protein